MYWRMIKMNTKISIVLPTYNGEKYIRKSIESILGQTYTNWELIVVNDCSTDNTLKIVEQYMLKDSRIRLISNETNQKLPRALNIGFKKATGEFLTWTSDDNIYFRSAFETMTDELKANKDIDLVYCNYNIVNLEDGEFVKIAKMKEPDELRFVNVVGACFLYRRALADKIGEYDPGFFLAEDYEYWIRAYLGGNLKHIDKTLYEYGVHKENLTSTRKKDIGKVVFNAKNKYFKELWEKCQTPEEKNRFLMEMLILLPNKKELRAVRRQYYKLDTNFRNKDIKTRMVSQKNRIVQNVKKLIC